MMAATMAATIAMIIDATMAATVAAMMDVSRWLQ